MKYFIFSAVFCLCFFSAEAQKEQQKKETVKDSTNQTNAVYKLSEGDKITWKNYCLFFEEVISDSRCPSDATCVWAGEAKVKLSIEENGHLLETKYFNLPNPISKEKNVFQLGNQSIQIFELAPYPTAKNKKDLDYYLRVALP